MRILRQRNKNRSRTQQFLDRLHEVGYDQQRLMPSVQKSVQVFGLGDMITGPDLDSEFGRLPIAEQVSRGSTMINNALSK